MIARSFALTLLSVLAACAAPGRVSPSLAPARIVEGASGREVAFDAMLDRLGEADAVFFGETHLDESTHLLELAVYEGLVERTGGRVVLAMEMFSREAQPLLDAYVAGEIDEATFLAGASPWSNYRTGYRAMVERARELGLPVVGSNVHAELRRKVSRGGRKAFEALSAEERAGIASQIRPNSRAYWERFARIVRAPAGQTTDPADYLWSGQSLWDNTMGASCAAALRARPGWLVYHVNGRFHTDYGQGTVDQFLQRSPGARAMTITASAVRDLLAFGGAEPSEVADYVAFVQDRARGIQDGLLAVRAGREVRYELHVPKGASDAEPLPLLVWLAGDGLRAEDAAAYWKIAFEDEAVVAALEPLYREREDDHSVGGRWVWPETLDSDVSNGVGAALEVMRYVSTYYPVDPRRMVLGGEGTGATVAAAAALFGEAEHVVALEPRDYRRLRLHGLPEPGGPERTLTLIGGGPGDREWWEQEVADYAASGLVGGYAPGDEGSLLAAESRARELVGLDRAPVPSMEPPDADGPRGRAWSAYHGRAVLADYRMPALDELPHLLSAGKVSGKVLPVPPGPFGGTTLLVVPATTSEESRADWLALDGSDVIRDHGSMHRLRVAVQGGEPSLDTVLNDLHRSNVLIVPAALWLDAEKMRAIHRECGDHLDSMTYTFLPGLLGRWHLARVDEP